VLPKSQGICGKIVRVVDKGHAVLRHPAELMIDAAPVEAVAERSKDLKSFCVGTIARRSKVVAFLRNNAEAGRRS